MTRALGALSLLLLSACAHKTSSGLPVPSGKATCYTARYDNDSLASRFPSVVILDPGRTHGKAFWPPTNQDSIGVWRMFYVGKWERPQSTDSTYVRYSNGFTSVELRLVGRTASPLLGDATWYSDVIDGSPPPRSAVQATPQACSEALSRPA